MKNKNYKIDISFDKLKIKRCGIMPCIVILVFTMIISCKKAVQISPPITELVSTSVFNNSTSAIAAVAGIYQQMSGGNDFFIGGSSQGATNFTSIAGLSADEFQLYPNASPILLSQSYTNAMQGNSSSQQPFWSNMFNCIYQCNAVISGVSNSTTIPATTKQQLLGEAKFARALCNFYLVNIFGDIPLVTISNYLTNQNIARSTTTVVYTQIISDLTDAQTELSPSFVTSSGMATTERTLPNQTAAAALLARVYLYYGNLTGDGSNYTNAEAQATEVIQNTGNATLVNALDSVFLANSSEALWQLQPVQQGFNTPDGFAYILTMGPNTSSNPIFLSNELLSAFEPGDNRKTSWIANYGIYFYAYKYKVKGGEAGTPVTEYYTVLRLSEQYLIRAEARTQKGEANSVNDLNIIRNRAGLPNYSGPTDKTSLLAAILHERQVELFAEFGHRWLDLKRTGNINALMSVVCPLKGGVWKPSAQLFPIPLSDIKADPSLTQNPGY